MAVTITISQSGKPAGTAGKAREDLDVSTAVTLTAGGGTFGQHQWTIVDAPPNAGMTAGSGATLTAPTASATNLTPDNDGTYLVMLEVDAGYGLGARDEDVAKITFYAGSTLNATIDELPRRIPSWLEMLEHNIDTPVQPSGSTLGWAWEWMKWFRVIQRIDSELLSPPGGGDDYQVAYGLSNDLAYASGVTVNAAETALHVDDYVRVTSHPTDFSTAGQIRGSYTIGMYGFTSAANHRVIEMAGGVINLGSTSLTGAIICNAVTTTGYFMWQIGGSVMMHLDATDLDMQGTPVTNAAYFAGQSAAGFGTFRGGTTCSLYGVTSAANHPMVELSGGSITVGDVTLTTSIVFRVNADHAFSWVEQTVSNQLMRLDVADGLTLQEDGNLNHGTKFKQDATARAMLIKPFTRTAEDGLNVHVFGGDTAYGYAAGSVRMYMGGGGGVSGFVEMLNASGYLIGRFSNVSGEQGLFLHYPNVTPTDNLFIGVASGGSALISANDYPSGYNTLVLRGALVQVQAATSSELQLLGGSNIIVRLMYDTVRKIGLYGAAPVAQPADPNALTDSTTGTPGTTIAALPNPADSPADADALRDDLVANVLPVLRNWAASFVIQHNKFRTGLSATAGGIGAFA